MNNSENQKIDHEISVCKNFLNIYSKDIKFLRHGIPEKLEADCICTYGYSVEIVGIYDNENQARKIWKNKMKTNVREDNKFNLFSFDHLNKKISEKIQKLNDGLYDGSSENIILVCDMLSPTITQKDIDIVIKSYIPFKKDDYFKKYFYEIWMLWKDENNIDYKIKKLE